TSGDDYVKSIEAFLDRHGIDDYRFVQCSSTGLSSGISLEPNAGTALNRIRRLAMERAARMMAGPARSGSSSLRPRSNTAISAKSRANSFAAAGSAMAARRNPSRVAASSTSKSKSLVIGALHLQESAGLIDVARPARYRTVLPRIAAPGLASSKRRRFYI